MEDTPGIEGEVNPLERDGSVWREEGGRDWQWSCRSAQTWCRGDRDMLLVCNKDKQIN